MDMVMLGVLLQVRKCFLVQQYVSINMIQALSKIKTKIKKLYILFYLVYSTEISLSNEKKSIRSFFKC